MPFTSKQGPALPDLEIMIFLFTAVFGWALEIVIRGILLSKSTRMYLEK